MTVTSEQLSALSERLASFLARLDGLIVAAGVPDPATGLVGAFYFDTTNGALYGPKTAGGWGTPISLVGPQGLSAKAIVIAAGLLPAGASDADFGDWLANAQIAAVRPFLDAAVAARDAAQAAQAAAEAAQTAAAGSATAAGNSATAAAGSATSAAASATAAGLAEDAAEASATGAAGSASTATTQATAAAASATAAAASATSAAADRIATAADRIATAADAAATAADRIATAADAAATDADRIAAAASAATATTKAGEASASATAAAASETAAKAAQAAAEAARDQAQAIVGGDIVTGPATHASGRVPVWAGADSKTLAEGRAIGAASSTDLLDLAAGDGRYQPLDSDLTAIAALSTTEFGRSLLTLADAAALKTDLSLGISDITGLATALAGKLTAATGQIVQTTRRTSAYTAVNGDRVLASTSAGAWTLTLPASGYVEVVDVDGTWATHNLTIVGTIRGNTGNLVCDVAGAHLIFAYDATNSRWIVTRIQGVSA